MSVTAPPRFSIGLPVHNGAATLMRAIDSLRAQTVEDLEIVVSDNASTDDTPDIGREAARQDPRVRYSRTERLLSVGESFQRALDLTSGRWFHWACHDDWLEPGFLATCAAVGEQDPGIVTVITATREVDPSGRTIQVVREQLPGSDDPDPARRIRSVLWRLQAGASVSLALHRSEALRRTQRLRNLPQQDRLLGVELAWEGRIHVLDDVLQHRSLGSHHRSRDPWRFLDSSHEASKPRLLRRHLAAHRADIARMGLSPSERRRLRAEAVPAVLLWKLRSKIAFELHLRRRLG